YLFNNQQLGNNTSPNLNTSRLGTQGLSNFAVGRVNGDLGYGGLVLSAGSESVSVLLRALAARRRIDVLSRPQVQALDNQLATIQVGQEVPRVNSFTVNQTTGNATPLVQARNVGIILEVIPRVSPDGMVVMEVSARKDALNAQGVPLFTNPDGSVISSPIIDTTNAQTSVIVRNGQTIVLGGMITSSNIKEERKVPLLGDIPFIGQLFRADFKETRRTELLIFLTPRIIRNEEEAELIKEIETQRINFIECEAEAMHGPLFGVPAEDPLGIPASTGYGSSPSGSSSFEAVPPMPRRDRSPDGDTPRGGSGGWPWPGWNAAWRQVRDRRSRARHRDRGRGGPCGVSRPSHRGACRHRGCDHDGAWGEPLRSRTNHWERNRSRSRRGCRAGLRRGHRRGGRAWPRLHTR
ncbi:MAG: type II secretion system protein GspD, partial [Planctomycetaceae bacterium]